MSDPALFTNALVPKSNIDPHGLIVGHGDFKYKINAHWGALDPKSVPVENCHALAIDSKERIIMLTDDVRNNFIIYNKDGKLLETWGTEYPGAHSIKVVNENGEDFIYIVDSGWITNPKWDGISTDAWDSPFNKVIAQSGFVAKLTIEGRLIFTIGHPQTIDVYRPDQPFRPTDIAIAPNGDLYITDGYGSDYLLQYDHQGRFIRRWGGHDNKNEHDNLVNTHGVEVDLRTPNKPNLIVSSRAENALKVFSLKGEYISTIATPGMYIGGPVFKGDYFYAPVCWSHIDGTNADDSGFITIMDKNNKVVSNPGGTEPVYVGDELQPTTTNWQVFNHCHAVCVDNDDNLYVGQWRANNSYPLKLERI
ncbi:6-bladed beta-propeller [Algibacillus agarilyticus]|uniref:6-bladed beta-propeller n=1 Tax=Algibacillus agarilyticus TaxID=2234133 RepID=UPI000DCFD6E9|nr:6-bladed beta-propeller [Algibacillus agarilyticus]